MRRMHNCRVGCYYHCILFEKFSTPRRVGQAGGEGAACWKKRRGKRGAATRRREGVDGSGDQVEALAGRGVRKLRKGRGKT